MVVEHTIAFVERLVVDIVLASGMVGNRMIFYKMGFSAEVLTPTTHGEIVATKMVVDRMVLCFQMVDFGLCNWVELLLDKLTM